MSKIKEWKDRYAEWSKQPAGVMTKGDTVKMTVLFSCELLAGMVVGYLTGFVDCLCKVFVAAEESEQE